MITTLPLALTHGLLDEFKLTVAIITATFAFFVASRYAAHFDSRTPSLIALAGFIVGWFAASLLTTLLLAAALIAALGYVGWLFAPSARMLLRNLTQGTMNRLSARFRRTYTDRGRDLTADHDRRREWLSSLPIDDNYRKQLLDNEQKKLKDSLSQLSDQYPYLDGQAKPRDFSSWFEPDEDDEP